MKYISVAISPQWTILSPGIQILGMSRSEMAMMKLGELNEKMFEELIKGLLRCNLISVLREFGRVSIML